MKTWTRKDRRVYADTAERLVEDPSGGRVKQWLAGVFLAAWPIVYGIVCLQRGHTTLFGWRRRGGNVDLVGDAGFWLAVAYIAIGAFLHFHYFWGLSERLSLFSRFPKALALLVFVSSLFYTLFLMVDY
jgi:hypothetical protein